MRIDNHHQRIYVRQSWIGDYLLCPERARLGVTLPHFRSGSDATAIGTGIHSAIEWAINSHTAAIHIDRDEMVRYAQEQVAIEMAKPIKLTKVSDKPIAPTVDAMVNSWIDTIAMEIEWGGSTELGFRFPSGLLSKNGYEIWYEGTIDYVEPSGTLWDWKTAGRAYFVNEKQNKAHQPTVYCQFIKHHMALEGDQSFRYGVMVRGNTPKGQVVDIVRNDGHYRWLNRQVQTIVNNALLVGETSSWPMNDQGVLCSSTWCSFWSVCKGAVV